MGWRVVAGRLRDNNKKTFLVEGFFMRLLLI